MPRKKLSANTDEFAVNGVNGTDGADEQEEATALTIMNVRAPNFAYVSLRIIGTSIYCQNKFGQKALEQMRTQQLAGGAAKARKVHDAKDFDQLYRDAMHLSKEGWAGIPSSAFRNALIDACRTCGGVMTRARLAIFCVQDGHDAVSGEPLTRITVGEPYKREMPVRNANGVIDIRARPVWDPGWEAIVTLRYDRDMISLEDVVNLMVRVGLQVGIGEGRPSSKKSNGIGWGLFDVEIAADHELVEEAA